MKYLVTFILSIAAIATGGYSLYLSTHQPVPTPAPVKDTSMLEMQVANLQSDVAALFNRMSEAVEQTFGADTFKFFSGKVYRLAGSGIGTTDTSITLTSFTKPISGEEVTMDTFGTIGYITLEPTSSTNKEFISFSGVSQDSNSTNATLTGVTRGLMFESPYTASTSLRRSHSGGSKVIVSNPPQLYDKLAAKGNDESVTGLWDFASTTPPRYDLVPANHNTGAIVATTSEFASMAALQAVVAAGCLDAAEGNQGCVELATAAEQASSTQSGSDARLVMQARYATDTPQAICNSLGSAAGAGCAVIAGLAGKISQTFLDIFTTNNTYTGTQTYNGANTHNATSTWASGVKTMGANIFMQALASTTITGNTTPQPVYLATSTNALNLSDANVDLATDFLGFAVSNGTNGATTTVQIEGVVPGFTGLTRGQRYYVQDAVGTIGTSMGTNEIFVGTAISATEIDMEDSEDMQYIGTASGSTVAIPLLARMMIVQSTGSYTCAGGGGTVQVQHTLLMKGATSATDGGNTYCDGNSAADLRFSITSTITGFSLAITQSGMTSVSSTVYFYR